MVPDGWKQTRVGEALEIDNTKRKPISAEERATMQGPYPYYGPTKVQDWINEYSYNGRYALIGEDGDHFLKYATLGQTQIADGKFNVNNHAHALKSSRICLADWFYFYFQNRSIEAYLTRQGAKRYKLNKASLEILPILVPPLHEQKRIAEILSTWDRAVQATEKLIANCRAQKKALMQQLLTGKNRYSEFIKANEFQRTKYGLIPQDWNFVQIGSIADEISERNVDGDDIPVLSCTKYDGFVSSLEYFKKKVFSDDTSNYKLIKYGQFGFPSNHIEEGSIGLQNIADIGQVSPIYCVFQASDKIDNGYLYKLLKTEHYRQIFAASTNASVDRRGSLRWREFAKIYVPLPTLPEQKKISKSIDSVIAAEAMLKRKLAAIQREKTALMQQLLTGKRRVKIEEEYAVA